MRSGRSALGMVAGVLLGLGVVALAGPGLNMYGTQSSSAAPSHSSYTYTSLQSATATNTSGAQEPYSVLGTSSSTLSSQNTSNATEVLNSSFGFSAGFTTVSQVNSIVRPPINLTGYALLPVLAAFLFGFVLYRVSRTRNEEEEISEPA